MYNIIRSIQVNEDEYKGYSINSNQLVQEKLEDIQKELEEERQRKEAFETLSQTTEEPVLDEDGNPVLDEDGNPVMRMVPSEDSPDKSATVEELLQEARKQADEILASAHAEADEILSRAESEAVAIRNRALEDGTREGLQKGTMEAQEQLDHMTTQLREQEQQIKNEYNDKYKTMEQDLVDTILGVLDHVFMAECSGKRDIVIHLIDVALSNADSSKEFQIHVSPAIAEKIADKQKGWQKYLGNDVQLDIIPDPLFKDQNCTIESDGGIFDCSLDTELDNLFRDIRALSYQEQGEF